MNEENSTSNFINLIAYKQGEAEAKAVRGNLIKANGVKCTGARKIEVSAEDEDQPAVITHREGETIVAVEFRCKCGCSTIVEFDYERP